MEGEDRDRALAVARADLLRASEATFALREACVRARAVVEHAPRVTALDQAAELLLTLQRAVEAAVSEARRGLRCASVAVREERR